MVGWVHGRFATSGHVGDQGVQMGPHQWPSKTPRSGHLWRLSSPLRRQRSKTVARRLIQCQELVWLFLDVRTRNVKRTRQPQCGVPELWLGMTWSKYIKMIFPSHQRHPSFTSLRLSCSAGCSVHPDLRGFSADESAGGWMHWTHVLLPAWHPRTSIGSRRSLAVGTQRGPDGHDCKQYLSSNEWGVLVDRY